MKTSLAVLIVLSLFVPGVALAGEATSAPILIDMDNRAAQGDMVSARYSKNDVEFIGCGIRMTEDGSGGVFEFGFCQAADAMGNEIFCATLNSELLSAIASTAAYSFLLFGWNESGDCTRIGVSNQSLYLPEKLKSN